MDSIVSKPSSNRVSLKAEKSAQQAANVSNLDWQDSVNGDESKAYATTSGTVKSSSRKRKHESANDDLEGRYLQKIEQEKAKEDAERRNEEGQKRQGLGEMTVFASRESSRSASEASEIVAENQNAAANPPILQHESLAPPSVESELAKASRTVFLANISTTAIKSKSARKKLLDHLESFIPKMSKEKFPHKIDSLRFRSVAFLKNGLPKKVAYAKKELMDSTTKSTNAYAVYSTQSAAREAVKELNGTVILDRHLRVDGVAHPAKVDHRRCVFVGNLSFVDNETTMNAVQDEERGRRPRKAREPADAEEGLWRQFSQAGIVESVRVIRDKTTRVGKGFAYVQFRVGIGPSLDWEMNMANYSFAFKDVNAVEKALLYDGKIFPPMLPRSLRVTRAKALINTASFSRKALQGNASFSRPAEIYRHKPSSQALSLSSRAGKLFGRAGAARLRKAVDSKGYSRKAIDTDAPSLRPMVFEGHRASNKHGKSVLTVGRSGQKSGKPRTRSSRRGAAFKASARKKS